jgi:hypothetical protein
VIPAVKGTETILVTALKVGPQLSSVVVTSSVAAIIDATTVPGHVFTEEHNASVALDRANRERAENVKSPGVVLYSASKTAADRAVWKFKQEHKASHLESSKQLMQPLSIYSNTHLAIICDLNNKPKLCDRSTDRPSRFRITAQRVIVATIQHLFWEDERNPDSIWQRFVCGC